MKKKKLGPDKNELKKFKENALKLFEKQTEFKQIEKEFNNIKKKLTTEISNFMFVNGYYDSIEVKVPSYDYYADVQNDILRITRAQQRKVIFDADKVEKVLTKKQRNDIIQKEYTINDMPELISYLKECGVDPKIFKSFIDVEKKVNVGELEQNIELGNIDECDLKGTYKVNKGNPYIRITAKKESIEDDKL